MIMYRYNHVIIHHVAILPILPIPAYPLLYTARLQISHFPTTTPPFFRASTHPCALPIPAAAITPSSFSSFSSSLRRCVHCSRSSTIPASYLVMPCRHRRWCAGVERGLQQQELRVGGDEEGDDNTATHHTSTHAAPLLIIMTYLLERSKSQLCSHTPPQCSGTASLRCEFEGGLHSRCKEG